MRTFLAPGCAAGQPRNAIVRGPATQVGTGHLRGVQSAGYVVLSTVGQGVGCGRVVTPVITTGELVDVVVVDVLVGSVVTPVITTGLEVEVEVVKVEVEVGREVGGQCCERAVKAGVQPL